MSVTKGFSGREMISVRLAKLILFVYVPLLFCPLMACLALLCSGVIFSSALFRD